MKKALLYVSLVGFFIMSGCGFIVEEHEDSGVTTNEASQQPESASTPE